MPKRRPSGDPPERVALVWYRRDQWQLLRSSAADPDSIEERFGEWLNLALEKERELRAAGIDVVRIDADVNVMLEYCRREKIRFDSAARSRYAADDLRKQSLILA